MSISLHINSLPDLVLRRIFSKVPLQNLFKVGRVCALWRSYQLDITRKVRFLTLLIGSSSAQSLITNSCFTLKYRDLLLNEDNTRMYPPQHLDKRFHLTFDSFTFDGSAKLLNIFPHITTLEIVIKLFRGQHLLNPMGLLLAKWSPMLKSLKMYLQFYGDSFSRSPIFAQDSNEFYSLIKVINLLQSLEHLTLDSDTCIDLLLTRMKYINPIHEAYNQHVPGIVNSFELPILGRLREFYFKSFDSLNIIESSLQFYAVPNDNLKKIGLQYMMPRDDVRYPRFPRLNSKIVFLPFSVLTINSIQVGDIFRSFPSITKLNLENQSFSENPSTDALKEISSLQQLTHLYLSYNPGIFLQAQTSCDLLPQLASVQVLSIQTTLKSTSDFESDNWAHLFPNVQVIELTISTAKQDNSEKTLDHLPKQELQQILSPISECPKLHHIYTCEKYSPEVHGFEHFPAGIIKEWILLQERDRKIIIQVEK